MRIDIITLYPDLFRGYIEEGLLKEARDNQQLELCIHPLTRWVEEPHRPLLAGTSKFGSRLLSAAPILAAVRELQEACAIPARVILLSPRGRLLTQSAVAELASARRLILICGRFGGFERPLWRQLEMDELSVGDYILNGGEVASMVVLDSLVRELPGLLESTAAYALPTA